MFNDEQREDYFKWIRKLDTGQENIKWFENKLISTGINPIPIEIQRLLLSFNQTGKLIFGDFVKAYDHYLSKNNNTQYSGSSLREKDIKVPWLDPNSLSKGSNILKRFNYLLKSQRLIDIYMIIQRLKLRSMKVDNDNGITYSDFSFAFKPLECFIDNDCHQIFMMLAQRRNKRIPIETILYYLFGELSKEEEREANIFIEFNLKNNHWKNDQKIDLEILTEPLIITCDIQTEKDIFPQEILLDLKKILQNNYLKSIRTIDIKEIILLLSFLFDDSRILIQYLKEWKDQIRLFLNTNLMISTSLESNELKDKYKRNIIFRTPYAKHEEEANVMNEEEKPRSGKAYFSPLSKLHRRGHGNIISWNK